MTSERPISKVLQRVLLCMGCSVLIFFTACREDDSQIRGSGTVEATELTISARSQGEVLSISVSEGEQVNKGAVLCRIDDEELRLQTEQAKRRLAALRAQLEILTLGAEPEDIRQAEAQAAMARQAYDLSKSSYERTKRLFQGGTATESELERVKTAFLQGEAEVEAAEAQLEKLRTMPRPQEVDAMKARVEEAEIGISLLERKIEQSTVVSPVSAAVVTVAREPGEYVTPGSPLFKLADLSRVSLTIYVSGPKLGRISLGQDAVVFVDGMAEREFSGRVSRISEEAEFTPKNVQTQDARAELVYAVKIDIENSEGVFKIGMPADALIETEGK